MQKELIDTSTKVLNSEKNFVCFLQFIPDGEWFCAVCRPRRRGRKPGRQKPSVDSDVEEEDFAEEEALQRDAEKEEEEETIVYEEER